MKFKRAMLMAATVAALASVFVGGVAYGRLLPMEVAIDNLQRAKENLRIANQNKGGHRASAMKLIDEAIREVREGIRIGGAG